MKAFRIILPILILLTVSAASVNALRPAASVSAEEADQTVPNAEISETDQTVPETEASGVDGVLGSIRNLQAYYNETQIIRSSTQTAEILAGGKAYSRQIQNTLLIKAGARAAAGIGEQARQVIAENQLSYDEYDTLLHIVEAEATAGDVYSKMLIACVVLNRVADEHFPDTIKEVVWERSEDGTAQFSPTADGRISTVTISEGTVEAVRRVLEGEDPSQGALYFVARESASADNVYWFDSNLKVLYAYGGHDFFTYRENED